VHNSFGYGPFTGGLGMHAGAELLGALVIPASGGKTQQQLTLIRDLKPTVLLATPSYALNLGQLLAESGEKKGTLSFRVGLFGAEPWSEEMRLHLEAALDLQALDIYGLSEIVGPGVAVECPYGKGYLHIWEDHFYPEILDPKTQLPLPEGQAGELTITTLTKEAMPLLRYRTGDISALTSEPCPCGRTAKRIKRIQGRLDDMLIIRGVNVYPSEIEAVLLQNEMLSAHYQIVLDKEGSLDRLSIKVEIQEEIYLRQPALLSSQTLPQAVSANLKETIGLTSLVELLPPKSIARSQGKATRVIDLREMPYD
jgi:phenylacetate-CoA ligase